MYPLLDMLGISEEKQKAVRLYTSDEVFHAVLLKDIIPLDQIGKKNPKWYLKGSSIQVTPFTIHVNPYLNGSLHNGLSGHMYKDKKTKLHYLITDLVEGVDYQKK